MSLYSRYESVSDTDKRSYNIYHSRIAGDKTTILNHERFYLWIGVVLFPLWYQNDKCFALCRKEKVWYWLWILYIHATIFERFGKILISTNVYIKGASKHFYFFFPLICSLFESSLPDIIFSTADETRFSYQSS